MIVEWCTEITRARQRITDDKILKKKPTDIALDCQIIHDLSLIITWTRHSVVHTLH